MSDGFPKKLAETAERNMSLLCVGLDPDPSRMALDDVFDFNREIIDATKELVCAYKPNLAFYEALGLPGLKALQQTVEAGLTGHPVRGRQHSHPASILHVDRHV